MVGCRVRNGQVVLGYGAVVAKTHIEIELCKHSKDLEEVSRSGSGSGKRLKSIILATCSMLVRFEILEAKIDFPPTNMNNLTQNC